LPALRALAIPNERNVVLVLLFKLSMAGACPIAGIIRMDPNESIVAILKAQISNRNPADSTHRGLIHGDVAVFHAVPRMILRISGTNIYKLEMSQIFRDFVVWILSKKQT
jgi:hypothetical protein